MYFRFGRSDDFSDMVFVASLVTSFASFVYMGLRFASYFLLNALNARNLLIHSRFNERQSHLCPTKLAFAAPMLMAFAGARAFTLAVFFKETLDESSSVGKTEWAVAVAVMLACAGINIWGMR